LQFKTAQAGSFFISREGAKEREDNSAFDSRVFAPLRFSAPLRENE
jgi:hypothetical protein